MPPHPALPAEGGSHILPTIFPCFDIYLGSHPALCQWLHGMLSTQCLPVSPGGYCISGDRSGQVSKATQHLGWPSASKADNAAQSGDGPPRVCLQEAWPWLIFMFDNEYFLYAKTYHPGSSVVQCQERRQLEVWV